MLQAKLQGRLVRRGSVDMVMGQDALLTIGRHFLSALFGHDSKSQNNEGSIE